VIRSNRARAATLLLAALFAAAACAPAVTPTPPPAEATPTPAVTPPEDDLTGQEVTVIGTWGGAEQEAFLAMVRPWEERTGARVRYTGTRDLTTVLTVGVASGVLPDLAGLPGPGQMAEWADSLVDLGTVIDVETYRAETAAPLVELGTVDGRLIGAFMKTAIKGLIWYNPTVVDVGAEPPATWDQLEALIEQNRAAAAAPWCIGIESGAASGWPGTDWIENFVLRQSGPDVYNAWWQGQVKWTDPAIRTAFEAFGEAVAESFGGSAAVNATNFAVAGDPLFTTPPGCLLHQQASFITGLGAFAGATAGEDYDFFPFPDINPQFAGSVMGAGDLFGMFNDTPAARSLMNWLLTAEAQNIWVRIGGALSANRLAVDYPDDISRRSAEILHAAQVFVFDASDLMPAAMNAEFWRAIVDYVADPGQLDSILARLDQIQAEAYAQ
jgi:alpha-glucoside transport system substrate-binding protein